MVGASLQRLLNGFCRLLAILQLDFPKPEFSHSKSEPRLSNTLIIMMKLLVFSTLLICALGYRVVPNMERGALNSDYLRKCVNASIIAIESYDQNGNNGLSYDEIKDVSNVKNFVKLDIHI